MVQGGFGDRAHQADRAATIDEADIVFGEDLAQGDGGFDKAGVGARAGAAIDTDGFDLIHVVMWHCNAKCVKSGVSPARAESGRRCLQNAKELLPEAVPGV